MEKVMILATPAEIAEGLRLFMAGNPQTHPEPDFEKDRLSKSQAAKLAGISIPTLNKQVKLGKFKQYNLGTRKYF
jgi:hypothetical protein